ncbi:MAG: cysteine synthase family protein, partial [archaeon]
MKIYNNVLELFGRTPLVRLKGEKGSAEIVAKLEYLNPGGSVKDRIALAMVLDAERKGLLKPGGLIVEPTSGNTGIGLALVAAARGYRTLFVLPDKTSKEKVGILRSLGAEIVLSKSGVAVDSPESDVSLARKLAEERGAFMPNQYDNPENPRAHYEGTGPEIWEASEGKVDALVGGMGTGGTLSGSGKFLKEKNPALLIVGADPEGSVFHKLKEGKRPDSSAYRIEGIGKNFVPGNVDLSLVDRFVVVSDADAFSEARRVAREEGLLVGGSAGAAISAARKIARELGEGKRVVVIVPDRG